MSAADFTGWAVEALIASTLLMAVVLLVRKRAQSLLGPQLAYWLWALPALRMAMPPLPASWRDSAAAPLTAASETLLVFAEPIVHPVAQAAAGDPFPWLLAITGAWGLGALAFFAWHGLAHISYVRRIISPPARHAQLPDGTTLVESDEAAGPVAFGIFKRFVAVPSDFAERYDADERKLALAHELGHHARGDLIANWIGLAVLACHWFNPIAWVAYRKFRSDQEMANDARVLGALPPIERHAYACAIVKAAHGRAVTAACHLHTIEDLKGRLRMLKASRKSRRVLMAGAVGIASLTVAGLGLTASGAAAEKIRTVAETQVAEMTGSIATVDTPGAPPEVATGADRVVELSRTSDVRNGKKENWTKLVIRTGDGRTETYRDEEAEAFLAAHPDLRPQTAPPVERRHRIVIRSKDGKSETYEGAAADAYLRSHPNMRPPLPPMPPLPAGAAPLPPLAPNTPMVITSSDNGKAITRIIHGGPGGPQGYIHTDNQVMEVSSGDCGPGNPGEFVRREEKGGKRRMIICERRIERYAADQARQAQMSTKFGLMSAMAGLQSSRAAINAERGMSEEQRRTALNGVEEAIRGVEEAMRDDAKGD